MGESDVSVKSIYKFIGPAILEKHIGDGAAMFLSSKNRQNRKYTAGKIDTWNIDQGLEKLTAALPGLPVQAEFYEGHKIIFKIHHFTMPIEEQKLKLQ